ncbi:MAG: S8 family serine peptidase [Chloroflexi bacterium]|nr:S8 family serine peptidase [Chloroflexota bacterium]
MDWKNLSPVRPAHRFSRWSLSYLTILTLLLSSLLNAALPLQAQTISSNPVPQENNAPPDQIDSGLVAVKFRPNVNALEANASYNYSELRPEKYFSLDQFREFGLTNYEADRVLPGVFYYQVSEQADLKTLTKLLKADPQVQFAEPSYKVEAMRTVNDTYYTDGRQYGLPLINAEGAWDVTTGTNVLIAVLDSGIRINHNDIPRTRIITNRARTFLGDPINGQFLQSITNRLLPTTNLPPMPPPPIPESPPGWTLIGPVPVPGAPPLDITPPDSNMYKGYYSAWDPNGHGTAIAGLLAANTNNQSGMAGVSWNALLLPIQVLDASGSGNSVALASGITYATDNKARIINLSVGGSNRSEVLGEAIRYAQNKGVIIVAAAGNQAIGAPTYPAAYSGVIGVGATDASDRVTNFSNFGADVSVVAPGAAIWTTYCSFLDPFERSNTPPLPLTATVTGSCASPQSPRNDSFRCNPNLIDPNDPDACAGGASVLAWVLIPPKPTPDPTTGVTPAASSPTASLYDVISTSYVYLNGTSFAAPLVTGVISLMLSVNPNLTSEQAQSILQQTADRVPGMVATGRDPYYGFGRVNAGRAVAQAQTGDVYANSKAVLQGRVEGALLADVVVSLDMGDRNTSVVKNLDTNTGGYRFENLAYATYYLRAVLPKQNRVLGPVTIYSTGAYDQVISVNFNFASSTIIAGDGAVPPNQWPGIQPAPTVTPLPIPPAPLLAPNAIYFQPLGPQASTPERTFFPEVGHTLGGVFKSYWERNGGLSIFGFPISQEFQEVSTTDGKTYTVQYFERNRFEYHPEFAGSNNQILLGLLGSELTKGREFTVATPVPNTSNLRFFPETRHTLTDRFYNYWRNNGGLALFGYPISEPLQEGGFLVQYFERNRFEYHPTNAGTRYEVLLGLLGTDLARSRNYLPPATNAAIVFPENQKGD